MTARAASISLIVIGCVACTAQPKQSSTNPESSASVTPSAATLAVTPVGAEAPKNGAPINVTSTTFQADGTLPMSTVFNAMGCTGSNQSPQLAWSGFPPETKSFAVTLWDPDAPTGLGYVHWLVFNIPAAVTSLPANAGASPTPAGGVTGYSDFGAHVYNGPCPPPGDAAHHYRFTISALDVPTLAGAGPGTTMATLTFMMRGHLLAQGTLEGHYGR